MEGAEDLLAYLAPKYRLYLASNGTARVQGVLMETVHWEQVLWVVW